MLKKVFPLLLSYVFLTTQCWAISGGPDYGRGGKVSPFGLYSGALAGTSVNQDGTTSNAIGLFNLLIPSASVATGSFLLFASGALYPGTINGSVDPDSNAVTALVEGSREVTIQVSETLSTQVTQTAIGTLTAKISGAKSNSRVTARLTGTAFLDVEFGLIDSVTLAPVVNQVINFTVSGFRQTISTATGAGTYTLPTT